MEYVSPNIEKLVGIPTQKVLQNIYEIETLFKSDESVHILEELEKDKDDIVYGMVDDDATLAALGKVFAELIDDADIKY